jgi:hypothetical protein
MTWVDAKFLASMCRNFVLLLHGCLLTLPHPWASSKWRRCAIKPQPTYSTSNNVCQAWNICWFNRTLMYNELYLVLLFNSIFGFLFSEHHVYMQAVRHVWTELINRSKASIRVDSDRHDVEEDNNNDNTRLEDFSFFGLVILFMHSFWLIDWLTDCVRLQTKPVRVQECFAADALNIKSDRLRATNAFPWRWSWCACMVCLVFLGMLLCRTVLLQKKKSVGLIRYFVGLWASKRY